MPEHSVVFIGTIVVFALVYDFLNGFHDSANSISTIVSTRLMPPQAAVIWAAFFNFIAFLIFGLNVADTIGNGLVSPGIIDPFVILGVLIGAITWNFITWYYGIPSSSSHGLIGSLGGAAIAKGGLEAVQFAGFAKIAVSIVLAPVLGMMFSAVMMRALAWVFRRSTPQRVNLVLNPVRLISAGLYSLGHGGNDAQKTMGIITVLLFSTGYAGEKFHVPFWVVIACHTAMGLGTLCGGWRIVRTLGMRITKLKTPGAFCAETGGAMTLFLATGLGIPVSTTHTITGAIIGAGAISRLSAVRWKVAGKILWAWILTIPLAGAMGALSWWFLAQSLNP